jgi:hypothetical protein
MLGNLCTLRPSDAAAAGDYTRPRWNWGVVDIFAISKDFRTENLERAKGIEPSYAAWETFMAPCQVNGLPGIWLFFGSAFCAPS